jgi:hypothetical protein
MVCRSINLTPVKTESFLPSLRAPATSRGDLKPILVFPIRQEDARLRRPHKR